MNTFSAPWITGFITQCVKAGLPEKAACVLLRKAQEEELMQSDPDWRAGFTQTMSKFASQLDGMFSAPDKAVGDFGVGAALGGVAGLGLGAAALLRPRIGMKALAGGEHALTASLNPRKLPFFNSGVTREVFDKPMNRLTNRLVAHGRLPSGSPPIMMPKKENIFRYLTRRVAGPGNMVLGGSAAAGGLLGGVANATTGALPGTGFGLSVPNKDNWLPSYLGDTPGAAPGDATTGAVAQGYGNNGMPNSVWKMPGGFSTDIGPGGGTVAPPTYANSRHNAQALQSIDNEMGSLQQQMHADGSLHGALGNHHLQNRMQELQFQRNRIMQSLARETGGLRQDQARAGQGIADKLREVERAIHAREIHAQGASQWLERSADPGLGGMLRRGWNSLTGYEGGATQLDAELRQLYNMRAQLQAEQRATNSII